MTISFRQNNGLQGLIVIFCPERAKIHLKSVQTLHMGFVLRNLVLFRFSSCEEDIQKETIHFSHLNIQVYGTRVITCLIVSNE